MGQFSDITICELFLMLFFSSRTNPVAKKDSDALAFLPSGTFPDPVLIFYATRCASSSSCRRQDCPPSSETKLLQ
jgi:hypothetical protein